MKLERIYVLNKHKKLFSFNDQINDIPILEKKLHDWHHEITRKLGLELIEVVNENDIQDQYYLVFENNIFFSFEFLQKAIKTIERLNYIDVGRHFCMPLNRFNKRFSLPNQNDEKKIRKYNFYFKLKGNNNTKECVLNQKIYDMSLQLPLQLMKSGEFDYDQCDTYITTILSPFHLLQTNLYMLVSNRLVKYRKKIPDSFQKKIDDRSPLFFNFLRWINRIGKKSRIHPTAVIEGCIIGNNVIIGAQAVVRLSYIGDGCIIEDHCTVLYSVIGEGTCIAHNNLIVATMCYANVYLIHGPYQFSIYGKNTAVFATINCDFRIDQKTIKIMTDKGLMDSGQQFLGIAFGHRSKVSGGNVIAPGRIVPNDYWISSPDSIITKFPEEKNSNVNKDTIHWY